jgi:hypothetical protein
LNKLNPEKWKYRILNGLFLSGLVGWALMLFASLLFIMPPVGGLVLYESLGTTYIDYLLFQTYTNFSVLGLYLVGIGLFGFFLRFKKWILLVASLTSFLATILIWRCKFFPDWSSPSSGYTWEMIAAFDLLFLTTSLPIILPMFLFGSGFYRIKERPENLDIPIYCIILSSGYGLTLVISAIVHSILRSSSLSSLWGLQITHALSTMVFGCFFVLVLCRKGGSWIFKGMKPELRIKEKYWW